MLEKIEVTDENIRKIANAEFKQVCNKELNGAPEWFRSNWIDGAWQMLDDYNRVVEILNGDA